MRRAHRLRVPRTERIANTACGCEATAQTPPPGYARDTSCFDGCNWCVCTADGLAQCTAAACPDGGGATATSVPLPREECGCDEPPTPPPGMEPATTCFDGCNWCTCTSSGLANCTARACGDAGTEAPPPSYFECLDAAARVAETCTGQTDRACAHLAAQPRCGTERADVLDAAYRCLLDASVGTGSCRTFGDPSGATECLDDLASRTVLSDAADALASDVATLCPETPRTRVLTGGALPLLALSDATIARIATCIDGATSCDQAEACFETELDDIAACYR